jgi:TP901 family phage tail tape measure protein
LGISLGELSADVTTNTNGFRAGLNQSRREGDRFTRETERNTSSLSQRFGEVGASVGSTFKNIGGVMESAGKAVQNVGMNLTKYITIPLAGASIAAFKFGKDFEKELNKVVGLVGVSQKQVDAWGKDILSLSPEIGKAPQELAEALFFVTSAGIKGAEALDVVEMAGKGSAIGLGETKTIADLVTSAMNAYGKENLSAAKATDIVTMAVRQGKAEAAELAGSLGQVLPIASEMGVTFDQVAAATAAMTRTGTPATAAATELKAILSGLIKPSEQAEEQLKAMGTSSAEMRKKIKDEGLLSALMDLKDLTNKYGEEAVARVFPNIRSLMGVLDLMGANLEDNKKIFNEVSNANGTLEEAFKSTSETLDFKWNQALSQAQVVALSFFDIIKANLIPVLENVVTALSWVVEKFQSLAPGVQTAIIAFAGIAGILGPVLAIVGTVIAGLGASITALGTIISVVASIISTIGLPVIAAIAGVCIIVGAAIAGLIASFVLLWKTNEDFRKNVISIWNMLKTNAISVFNDIKQTVFVVFNRIKAFWKEHGDTITAYLTNMWNIILGIVKFAIKLIASTIKLVLAIIRGDWGAVWDNIKVILKAAFDLMTTIVSNFVIIFVRFFSQLGSKVINHVKNLLSGIKSHFNAIYTVGKDIGNRIIKAITSINFKETGRKIIQNIIDGLKSMISSLSGTASSIAATIRNKFPFSPAKEGPLKDLDKMDFYTSIHKALNKAKSKINMPALSLSEEVGNQLQRSKNLNVGMSTISNASNWSFSGPLNFYGVQDVPSLMEEIQRTIKRYSGR